MPQPQAKHILPSSALKCPPKQNRRACNGAGQAQEGFERMLGHLEPEHDRSPPRVPALRLIEHVEQLALGVALWAQRKIAAVRQAGYCIAPPALPLLSWRGGGAVHGRDAEARHQHAHRWRRRSPMCSAPAALRPCRACPVGCAGAPVPDQQPGAGVAYAGSHHMHGCLSVCVSGTSRCSQTAMLRLLSDFSVTRPPGLSELPLAYHEDPERAKQAPTQSTYGMLFFKDLLLESAEVSTQCMIRAVFPIPARAAAHVNLICCKRVWQL